ncbi:hypothetical protein [Haloarcula salinisoli]|uniref:CARDB protein n=1 Tax=Haloarcula salinisoli TaxID=2487746 RepID=A0A8J8CAT3_9EURY|nr:hypothetical protein [Halomicroarcula salinisoli]MBX0285029.1 hypothetical protein [Halomicroarcula salinisoli]MBX0303493.1 hypothetical protein [Halomicroarcula salinisoli]
MNRRRLIVSCSGCLAALAGCLTESTETPTGPAGSGNESPTEPPGTTPTGQPPAVGVENVVAQKAVTYSSVYGSGGVRTDPNTQYVVASITDASKRNPPEFVLETDSQTFESGLSNTRGYTRYGVAGYTRPYLVFPVPSPLSVSNPRIRLTERDGAGYTWSLPERATETLAAPAPRFELESLTVPDSVGRREDLTVSLTVRNVSDTDGRFLAAAYWPTTTVDDDESHVVEATVPAGETAARSLDIYARGAETADGVATLTVEGHVSASRTVQVDERRRTDDRTTEAPP